jgi:hypothetical protein
MDVRTSVGVSTPAFVARGPIPLTLQAVISPDLHWPKAVDANDLPLQIATFTFPLLDHPARRLFGFRAAFSRVA